MAAITTRERTKEVNERDILIWAAGGPPLQEPVYDEARLLPAVAAHHLEIRLDRRLAVDRPGWATAKLIDGVASLAGEVRVTTRRLYAALAEILANVGEAERPLLIKGASYTFLTGHDHMLTRSADLDLFTQDLPGLRDSLVKLGYVVHHKNPPEPFGRKVRHEYAKLNRGDVEIDLHSRYPAWRYPKFVSDHRSTSPADNPGIWPCINNLVRGEVTVEGLFANRVERPGFDGIPVPVLRPEMTVVISCCHIFANYLAEFPSAFATIRLGELANLAELASSPEFDWSHFASLTAKYDADDAVAYAFTLAERWLGVTLRPPANARRTGQAVPPRALWFARGDGAFLIATSDAETPEDVIVRSSTTADLLRHLGATAVSAGDAEPSWYSTLPDTRDIPLERVLTHATGDSTFGVRFSIRWSSGGLGFTVDIPEPSGTEIDLLCYFGQTVIECIEHPDGERFAYDRLQERRIALAALPFRRLAANAGLAKYEWTIPWERLPGATDVNEIPMLLGARRWSEAGDAPVAGLLCPLRVQGPA
jgi:hypothetical protein